MISGVVGSRDKGKNGGQPCELAGCLAAVGGSFGRLGWLRVMMRPEDIYVTALRKI